MQLAFAVMTAFLSVEATAARADWVDGGSVNGVQTYHDTATNLTWTVTLGQVPSADWGNQARQRVQAMGFRLPTFEQLQVMYNHHGGGAVLGIRNGLCDYYETADPNILGNAHGNGFRTRLPRKGIGYNWYIGVR